MDSYTENVNVAGNNMDEEIGQVGEVLIQDNTLLPIEISSCVDVLDERLYCYDSAVFSLTPAIQARTSNALIAKIEKFIDSAPSLQRVRESIKNKIEYVPIIPDDMKQALKNGTAELIPCKGSDDSFYMQIRTTIDGLIFNGKEYAANTKIKDIAIEAKSFPADLTGAMQCLSMQNQLNRIYAGLKEISEACEFNFGRVIQGQRDDRLAKLLSGRSCFIQALAISDENIQRQMMVQALSDANAARAVLAFQIKSDILVLCSNPNKKVMEETVSAINTAIIAMNNAVQVSLYVYQILGERNAQLAAVKEHEVFIKQVLLKEIKYGKNKYSAWELICSSSNSGTSPKNSRLLPTKLLDSCTVFIAEKNKVPAKLLEVEADV